MAGPVTQHFEKNRTQALSYLMMMKSLQEELDQSTAHLKRKRKRLDINKLKFWKKR